MDNLTNAMDSLSTEPNLRAVDIDYVRSDAMDEFERRWEQKAQEKGMELEAAFKQNPTWMTYLPDYERIIKEDYAEAIVKGQIYRGGGVPRSGTVIFNPKSPHCEDQKFRDGFCAYCRIQGYQVWDAHVSSGRGDYEWEFHMRKVGKLDT